MRMTPPSPLPPTPPLRRPFRSTIYTSGPWVLALTEASQRAGSWKDRADTPHGIQWVKDLPLLGATFNVGDSTTPTWQPAVLKLERRLAAWSGRKLSFQGKLVIINTLALYQIWHLCHIFAVSRWAEKRINKAVWIFFWSGKRDLVGRSTVSLPKSRIWRDQL